MRYDPVSLERAMAILGLATTPETVETVRAVIRARRENCNSVALRDVAAAEDAGALASMQHHLNLAHREIMKGLRLRLLDLERLASPSEAAGADDVIGLASDFVALLDDAAPCVADDNAPEPDASTAAWLSVCAACARSGQGHHLLLRCRGDGQRSSLDFAHLAAARGVRVVHAVEDRAEAAALRAELHGGAEGAVIIVDAKLDEAATPDDDIFDAPVSEARSDSRSSALERRLATLRGLRHTYVWRCPHDLVVDPGLAAFVGGAIGPLEPTRRWRDATLAATAGRLGAVGMQALAARLDDPRDAGALGAVAKLAAAARGVAIDEAAVWVAASLSRAPAPVAGAPPDFDARLIVCDEDGRLLIQRAGEFARHGGRVLLWGPPGGGKSTYAQALAAATGRGAQIITAAALLARQWGATERIIADAFARAAADGTCLVIDEIDSLCGVRDASAPGGNGYLVRTLTNEFLRVLDGFPSIPIVASTNHLDAIDAAIRRRFSFVVHVADELPPDGEALAWRLLLGCDPPDGWVPIGAAVSDVANAARRCRLLGTLDPVSVCEAIARSRAARVGSDGRRPARRSLQ